MRTFNLLVTIALCLLLQAVLAPRVALGPVSPDFIVIAVTVFALYRGGTKGAVAGFVVGLLQDLANPTMLGLNALTKTLLGYVVGRIGKQTYPDNVVFLFGLFAVAAFAHDFVYLLFLHWPHVGDAFVTIVTRALPSALYTAVFGAVLERLAARFGPKRVRRYGEAG